jgi:hypothetical protein
MAVSNCPISPTKAADLQATTIGATSAALLALALHLAAFPGLILLLAAFPQALDRQARAIKQGLDSWGLILI